jgi:hypothetical protein
MRAKIENHNGVNTVVLNCDGHTQFNQNSRQQFRIADAAQAVEEILETLKSYQPANGIEKAAIRGMVKSVQESISERGAFNFLV